MRIPYPQEWSQASCDALDAQFEEARKHNLWFYHGGMSGPFWFSPDELETQQRNGKFVWGSGNWKLRPPQEYIDSLKRAVTSAQEELDKATKRVANV